MNPYDYSSTVQAGMLAEIGARDGHATFDNLQFTLKINRTTAQRELRALRERGLITSVRSSCNHKMLHSLTDDGWLALGLHQRRMEREARGQTSEATNIATRSTASLFDAPTYQPQQSRAYYRNNGNAHIPSRGVRC